MLMHRATCTIDTDLGAGGEFVSLHASPSRLPIVVTDDEIAALELARRVAARDVSDETLDRLEEAFDDLATRYATTPPPQLLPPLCQHLKYVSRLLEARITLARRGRLLVTGAWFALLTATVEIDLHDSRAGGAYLRTARQMAEYAGHAEIVAWCLETEAWDRLTTGGYATALTLSQQAQAVAPRGSSAHIQATAQEGRAWARMGQVRGTHDALDRTARLVSSLGVPERPEHHFQYDPGKAIAYVATTLSWIGDPAAEDYARGVVHQMESASIVRPRRAASARLDLALALVAAGKLDEAAAQATAAVTSGRVVASNWWRVREVVAGIERTASAEAIALRDACEEYCPDRDRRALPDRPMLRGDACPSTGGHWTVPG